MDAGEEAEGHDFEGLFKETGPTLWRAIYTYSGFRRPVADDAVAEAFARAIENGSSIRDPRRWLFRVAFRIAAAELKRERRGLAIEDRENDPFGAEHPDLVAALRRLSPAQRTAVYLHHQAGFSVGEVASLTGSSVPAIKVHLFRGRRRLRALLEEEADG